MIAMLANVLISEVFHHAHFSAQKTTASLQSRVAKVFTFLKVNMTFEVLR